MALRFRALYMHRGEWGDMITILGQLPVHSSKMGVFFKVLCAKDTGAHLTRSMAMNSIKLMLVPIADYPKWPEAHLLALKARSFNTTIYSSISWYLS